MWTPADAGGDPGHTGNDCIAAAVQLCLQPLGHLPQGEGHLSLASSSKIRSVKSSLSLAYIIGLNWIPAEER